MNPLNILYDWLQEHGLDGFTLDGECCCFLDDQGEKKLCHCWPGEMRLTACQAGKKSADEKEIIEAEE